MKLAVFSDVHSNLEALDSAFCDMDKRGVDMRVCLGDVVGYGASVNEVVELVSKKADIVVVGNHDKAVLGEIDISSFNNVAKLATLWTQEQLSDKSKRFLKSLRYQVVFKNMLFTHASPFKPKSFRYIINEVDVLDAFDSFEEEVCFFGHSHVSMVLKKDDKNCFTRDKQTVIDDIAMINAGSIGQPRDGSAFLSYVVYDTITLECEMVRLKYEVAKAAKKIIDAGLPEVLAKRLFVGQ